MVVFIPPLPEQGGGRQEIRGAETSRRPEFSSSRRGAQPLGDLVGIFSSEQANDRLESLREKVEEREEWRAGATRPEQVSFEVNGPEPMVDAAREAVTAQLPDAKAADCGRR